MHKTHASQPLCCDDFLRKMKNDTKAKMPQNAHDETVDGRQARQARQE